MALFIVHQIERADRASQQVDTTNSLIRETDTYADAFAAACEHAETEIVEDNILSLRYRISFDSGIPSVDTDGTVVCQPPQMLRTIAILAAD